MFFSRGHLGYTGETRWTRKHRYSESRRAMESDQRSEKTRYEIGEERRKQTHLRMVWLVYGTTHHSQSRGSRTATQTKDQDKEESFRVEKPLLCNQEDLYFIILLLSLLVIFSFSLFPIVCSICNPNKILQQHRKEKKITPIIPPSVALELKSNLE